MKSLLLGVILVGVGCILNNVVLESMIKREPSSGAFITLAQFVVVAFVAMFEMLDMTLTKGSFSVAFKTRKIPIDRYFIWVLLQFSLSILNNITFGFKIPVPLHMLYRSGSLIFSVIMGYLLYRTTYSRQKLIGVAIVTVGIFLSTRASMPSSPPSPVTCTNCNEPAASASVNNTAEMEYDMVQFVTGIIILTVTVLMASGLSCYQDTVFKQHGKEPIEALFYTHAMSLPWFAVASSSILDSWTAYNKSDVETYTGLPILWLLLICNVITQYACIRGVYILLSSGSALTTNLVITLRKFTSLIVSVALFNNRFTTMHWLATILVFGGTALYTFEKSKPKLQEAKIEINKKE